MPIVTPKHDQRREQGDPLVERPPRPAGSSIISGRADERDEDRQRSGPSGSGSLPCRPVSLLRGRRRGCRRGSRRRRRAARRTAGPCRSAGVGGADPCPRRPKPEPLTAPSTTLGRCCRRAKSAAIARADADAVDDAVDDVLVEPVRRPGDRALDAADDDVGVEVVEVVLVDEHRVAGARELGCARWRRGTRRGTSTAYASAMPVQAERASRRPRSSGVNSMHAERREVVADRLDEVLEAQLDAVPGPERQVGEAGDDRRARQDVERHDDARARTRAGGGAGRPPRRAARRRR